jgi:hypothetical protein
MPASPPRGTRDVVSDTHRNPFLGIRGYSHPIRSDSLLLPRPTTCRSLVFLPWSYLRAIRRFSGKQCVSAHKHTQTHTNTHRIPACDRESRSVSQSSDPRNRNATRARDILDRLAEVKGVDSSFIVNAGAGQLVKSLRARPCSLHENSKDTQAHLHGIAPRILMCARHPRRHSQTTNNSCALRFFLGRPHEQTSESNAPPSQPNPVPVRSLTRRMLLEQETTRTRRSRTRLRPSPVLTRSIQKPQSTHTLEFVQVDERNLRHGCSFDQHVVVRTKLIGLRVEGLGFRM